MPLPAWLLLIVAVGLGLGLEVVFYRARLRDRREALSDPGGDDRDAGASGIAPGGAP